MTKKTTPAVRQCSKQHRLSVWMQNSSHYKRNQRNILTHCTTNILITDVTLSYIISACMRGRVQRINLNTMPARTGTAIQELRAETRGSQLWLTLGRVFYEWTFGAHVQLRNSEKKKYSILCLLKNTSENTYDLVFQKLFPASFPK